MGFQVVAPQWQRLEENSPLLDFMMEIYNLN
jgi:hypothetical protein